MLAPPSKIIGGGGPGPPGPLSSYAYVRYFDYFPLVGKSCLFLTLCLFFLIYIYAVWVSPRLLNGVMYFFTSSKMITYNTMQPIHCATSK